MDITENLDGTAQFKRHGLSLEDGNSLFTKHVDIVHFERNFLGKILAVDIVFGLQEVGDEHVCQ